MGGTDKDTDPETPTALGAATTDPLFPPKIDPTSVPEVKVTAVQASQPTTDATPAPDASIETLLTGLDDGEDGGYRKNMSTKPAPPMMLIGGSSESAGRDNARYALSARPLPPPRVESTDDPAVVVAPDPQPGTDRPPPMSARGDRTTVLLPSVGSGDKWKAFLLAALIVGLLGFLFVMFSSRGQNDVKNGPGTESSVNGVSASGAVKPTAPGDVPPAMIDLPATPVTSLPVASSRSTSGSDAVIESQMLNRAKPTGANASAASSANAPASSASSKGPPPDQEFGRKF